MYFTIVGKLGYGQLGVRTDVVEHELQRFRRLLTNQWLKDICTNGFLCTQSESKREQPHIKALDISGTLIM